MSVRPLAFGAGLVGTVGVAIGIYFEPRSGFAAYLVAYAFVISVVLGMLFFWMAVNVMNAVWPVALRRLGEAVLSTMPLLAVLFVPLFFGLNSLYPWTHPERLTSEEARALLLHKRPYLNVPFFTGRAIFYLALWWVTCVLLRRWSGIGKATFPPAYRSRSRTLSAVLLPLVGLTSTFAAFDWLMALSPNWLSTMFGVYFAAGGFLASIALLVVLLDRAQRHGALTAVGVPHYLALGRLLFAFLIFWGYIGFFQYMLIWIANRPTEVSWYLERQRSPYVWVSLLLIVGHFVIPFLLLLSYRVKQSRSALVRLAIWLLVMHYVDVHWLVAPTVGSAPLFSLVDLAALLCVGGFSLAFALHRQRGLSVVPSADPDYELALAYETK